MKNISLDLSGKIDSVTVDLLSTLNEAAKKADAGFFVTGAAARDLILEQGYGISSGRKTQDVDLGVMVDGWDAYNRLKEILTSTGRFVSDRKVTHRLLFKGSLPVA